MAPQRGTTYIVLRRGSPPEELTVLGTTQDVLSAKAAVKAYAEAEGRGPELGAYIAIPLRNWTEIHVTDWQPAKRLRYVEQTTEIDPAENVIPGQTTVDDVLADADPEELADAIEGDQPRDSGMA